EDFLAMLRLLTV
ncbi:unnamed protein product, partial [Allacma fusca]